MSKKSRKHNKKILGALAAGLGAMALMKGRGKKKFGTGAGFLKSGAAGGARLSSPPIGGTDHIPVVPNVVVPKKRVPTNFLASPKWNKMDISEVDTNYVAPSTQRYHQPDFGFGAMAKDGGRIGHKSGGRVKGAGCAKRGFGRALKKK